MPAKRLEAVRVEKPWGRHALWLGFADPAPSAPPIGEIWFPAPEGEDPALLVKYLFTGERLSIQVHPDDDQARARGYPRGKEEAWFILDATPEATIGLGTTCPLSAGELRAAAQDGSLEALMNWRSVKAGDVIYSEAGTVHAIGAGITLIEVQQNIDLTYRLYDYGRERELHLDDAVAVSRAEPFRDHSGVRPIAPDRDMLAAGRKFTLERWRWSGERHLNLPVGENGWLVVARGSGAIDCHAFHAGECWRVSGTSAIRLDADTELLFAVPGPEPIAQLD